MNKVFSLVWSRSLQRLVVASELASANGKQSGRPSRLGHAALGAVVLTASFALAPSAHAADAGKKTCAVALPGQASVMVECAQLEKIVTAAKADKGKKKRPVEDTFDSDYFKANGTGDGDDASAQGDGAIAIGSGAQTRPWVSDELGETFEAEGAVAIGKQSTDRKSVV